MYSVQCTVYSVQCTVYILLTVGYLAILRLLEEPLVNLPKRSLPESSEQPREVLDNRNLRKLLIINLISPQKEAYEHHGD